ncbi:MAG: multicopper oxidase family protein, partial [Paucilactobacillus nenjiangensis]
MTEKVFTDYFFDKTAFNVHDAAYVPLVVPEVPETKLLIPSILKPDKETATDAWYTLTAQAGETQMLPGAKTKTWGYGTSVLGQTIVYQVGKHNHVTLQN